LFVSFSTAIDSPCTSKEISKSIFAGYVPPTKPCIFSDLVLGPVGDFPLWHEGITAYLLPLFVSLEPGFFSPSLIKTFMCASSNAAIGHLPDQLSQLDG
jgi:hypothetical protein